MTKGIVCALLMIFFNGCCDDSFPRIQPHWLRALEDYDVAPLRVTRRTSDGRVQLAFHEEYSIGTLVDFGVAWSFSQANHPYGFWFELENVAGRSVAVHWTEARYLDEVMSPHEVYSQPRGPLPDDPTQMRPSETEAVRAGQTIRPTIVPIYKQYFVASGCRHRVPYSEPLIPSQLRGKSEAQVQAYVAALAEGGDPVSLVLPVEIDGVRYEYVFEFTLRNRWSQSDSD